MLIKTSTGGKSTEVKAERNLFGQLVVLAVQQSIDLQKILAYPLGPLPWSFATADGMLLKTDKFKLMHNIEKDAVHPDAVLDAYYVLDGMALIHSQV